MTMLIHRSVNGLVNGHFLSLRRGKCIVLARMHLTTADHRRNEVSEIFAFEYHHARNGDIIPQNMKYIPIEKTDGRIIKIKRGCFQAIVLPGKKKTSDILTGKFFRVLSHVVKEIGNIVFVAIDRTLFKVTDLSGLFKL